MSIPRWCPANPKLTSGTEGRSRDTYLRVVLQFEVTSSPRYKAEDGKTWCGHYCWDVTRAMCAEIPHWWLGNELNVNGMYSWLEASGPRYDWKPCTPSEAVDNANLGCPTVVAWRNPNGPGHIAMVLPGPTGGSPSIAQAGKVNFVGKSVTAGFGSNPLAFYRHP